MENYFDFLSLIVTIFIGYHIHSLTKKLSFKETLKKRENFQEQLKKLVNQRIRLVNIKRYHKDYPHGESKLFKGEVDRSSQLKNYYFDGIEVFEQITTVYKLGNGNYTFNEKKALNKNYFNCYVVGFIPYEWIDYIDEEGDEFEYRPQIFCHYKGWSSFKALIKLKIYRFPFKKMQYFIKTEDETTDFGSNGNNTVNYRKINIK